ncbi:MAG: Gfo/Idh/MocA family oxidoreductase [Verrucomicrobiales bacterium]|jgi:predicted dehydrogenase|nr:Gfo/Idh/MocA family oxidoreductase [Verrucomicrobiales bacterium]
MAIISSGPLRAGIIGCGNICNAYFKGVAPFADYIKFTACADLDAARAKAKAEEHQVPKALAVGDLLRDPDIDVVLNLTVPQAHVEVNLAALRAGKHVYCEKPFALSRRDGLKVLALARKCKRYVGCAPDTVLGGGIQTCRKLIDDGVIGQPVAAAANMLCHGHESWHPSPAFYYEVGGGPLFDMGPYYLTSLITMLGPARSVRASAKASFRTRRVTSQPLKGTVIKVETPTHLSGVVEFVSGATATVTMSFDVWRHHLPLLEVYGTEGSMLCPDPNCFDGEVLVWKPGDKDWRRVPLTHCGATGRGLGLAEMAYAIRRRRRARQDGGMALHVVEIMEAFHVAARTGRVVKLTTTCQQPRALPAGLPLGEIA